MKRLILCSYLFVLLSCRIFPQIDVKATLGVNFLAMPGLRDYLNYYYAGSQQLGVSSTAVHFSGEVDYQFEKMQVGFDLSSETNSYNLDQVYAQYKLSYGIIQPSLMVYRLIPGEGYKFRFGVGVGPRFLTVKETQLYLTTENSYTTTGWGIVGRIDASTALANSVYAYLGGDIGFNYLGVPSSGNRKL